MIKKITIGIIFATIVGLIIWDVIAYFKGGGGATISEVIYSTSKSYPLIPFAAGALIGHLFIPLTGRKEE